MNEEDNLILSDINDINKNIIPINKDSLNAFINDKEKEIKDILLSKINHLEQELNIYKKDNISLSSLNIEFKNKLDSYIKINKEQENDIISYEDKFNKLSNELKEKNEEIFEMKNEIKNSEIRINQEKEEKIKNEEYYKYKINKIKMQYNDEINNLKNINDNLNKEIINLKNILTNLNDKAKEEYELNINEKLIKDRNIKELNKRIEILKNELKEKVESINDIKLYSDKTNNENINIIREKIKLEQKLKENSKISSNYEVNLNLIAKIF